MMDATGPDGVIYALNAGTTCDQFNSHPPPPAREQRNQQQRWRTILAATLVMADATGSSGVMYALNTGTTSNQFNRVTHRGRQRRPVGIIQQHTETKSTGVLSFVGGDMTRVLITNSV